MAALLALHVPCPTPADTARWRAWEPALPGLELHLHEGRRPGLALARELLHETEEPFLLVAPDVALGDSFGPRAAALGEQLEALDPVWGLASVAGHGPPGTPAADFRLGPASFPGAGVRPRRVLLPDPAVLLLRPAALVGLPLPELPDGPGALALAGLAWVQAGAPAYAAAALMAYVPRVGPPEGWRAATSSPAWRSWAAEKGAGDWDQPTPRFGELPAAPPRPWRELLDQLPAATDAPGPAPVTVVCRTQLGRPGMLARLASSLAAAAARSPEAPTRLLLVSDRDREALEATRAELASTHEGLEVLAEAATVPEGRYSRGHLLAAGLGAVREGWAWVVDDDDAVELGAVAGLRAAARERPDATALYLDTAQVHETWDGDQLVASEPGATREGRRFLGTLGPHNQVPVCGVVLRADHLPALLEGLSWSGDYAEDHYLCLRVLLDRGTVPAVPGVVGARVSLRGDANTVAVEDRSWWRHSRAAFLGELAARGEGGAVLWEVLARPEDLLGHTQEVPTWTRLLGFRGAPGEEAACAGLAGSLARAGLALYGAWVLVRLGGLGPALRYLSGALGPGARDTRELYADMLALGAGAALAPASGSLAPRARPVGAWRGELGLDP